jgi:hypothetical protein
VKTATHTGEAVAWTGRSGPVSGDRHNGAFRLREEQDLTRKSLRSRRETRRKHRVGTVERFEAGVKGPRAQVWIDLLGLPQSHPRICSGCQRPVRGVHDWSPREVRDLPIFDADTVLMVWRAREACPSCGPKLEALDWLEPHARVTYRLAESAARLCKVMPIKRVKGPTTWGRTWVE